MCLGIPGKVVEIREDSFPLMGKVEFGGVRREVCLEYVSDVKVGEYVIVHVGFAISKLDESEAQKVFEYIKEIGGIEKELGGSE
ncbi:MAG: HypC/HybG/HupF family hydrogenase formation chaperone [Brevinematia bacterium]